MVVVAPPDSTNARKLAESGSCRGVLYCCAKEGATCACARQKVQKKSVRIRICMYERRHIPQYTGTGFTVYEKPA